MKKILKSLLVLTVVAGLATAATSAFFSDTETSKNNRFQAGALDLKVDSEAHYNGLVCTEVADLGWVWEYPESQQATLEVGGEELDHYHKPCEGTWEETNLGAKHRFFNFQDVKPGDEGENTISLHVYDNDAWGRLTVDVYDDVDVTCTEPEREAENDECKWDSEGELWENLAFYAWLDEGETPGFQNGGENSNHDQYEGDNVWQDGEPVIDDIFYAQEGRYTWDFAPFLRGLYGTNGCDVVNGDTDYERCHGYAADGRMVGSTTYYVGLAWNMPEEVGNEVQTDRAKADMTFEVVQHRNNSNPWASTR